MKREIAELAQWLSDEDEDNLLDQLSMSSTGSLTRQEDVYLLTELSDLISSDLG